MTGWRALLRLAARDARRDRWRTLLVVALIALPVAGLGAAVGIADTTQPTAEERVRDTHGDADLLVWFEPSSAEVLEDGLEELGAQLPTGSLVHPLRSATDSAILDGEALPVEVTNGAPGARSLTGARHRIVEGDAPVGDREVLVPPAVAERFRLAVGDTWELAELGPVTVTGLAVRREQTWSSEVLFAPEVAFPASLEPRLDTALVAVPPSSVRPSQELIGGYVFSDGTTAWAEARVDALGYRFTDNDRFAVTVIGGLGAVEAALIAGAAFAVSVRRRQRELGLLAAVGGSERHVRRVVQCTGLVAGGVGAIVGMVVAVAIVVFGEPIYGATAGRELAGPRVDLPYLLAVGLLGTMSAVVGAALPARAVARLPIVVALSGLRPVTAPARRGLAIGAGIAASGVLLLAVVAFSLRFDARPGPVPYLIGSVLVVLGVGAMSPWALERLAGLAPRLPVGPRLALRDAARFRTRNGPIVTAAMAGLAAMITITTVFGSLDAEQRASYRPSLADDQVLVWGVEGEPVAAALAAETGGATASYGQLDVTVWAEDGYLGSWPGVAGPELAAVLGAGPETEAALEAGHAVSFVPLQADAVAFARPGVEVDEWGVPAEVDLSVPVEVVDAGLLPATSLPTLLLPPSLAEELLRRDIAHVDPTQAPSDTSVRPIAHLVVTPDAVDATVRDAARELTASTPGVSFQVEQGYSPMYGDLTAAATLAGAVLGVALVAVALALASAEARADGRAMAAIGAGRRTRRSLAAGRALLLAGLAGVLAVPVGAIPAIALLARLRPGTLVVQVPWVAVAVAVLLVPLLAATGAALGASRSPKPSLRLAA